MMQIFTFVDNALLEGYALDTVVPDDKAYLAWKGGKIPLDLWSEIVAFLRAGYKYCNGECMGRLFYNEDTSEWRFEVFPQVSKGMHVDDSTDSDAGRELMALHLGAGYEAFGTVHHHCTSSAFQSGTDKDDELTAPGLHITVGHIESEELSLDMRFCFRGVMYAVNPLEWFESPVPDEPAPPAPSDNAGPQWIVDMRAALEAQFRKDALTKVLKAPALWLETTVIEQSWLNRIEVPAKSGKKEWGIVKGKQQSKGTVANELDELDREAASNCGWPTDGWPPVDSIPAPDDRFAGTLSGARGDDGPWPEDAAFATDVFDNQLVEAWDSFFHAYDALAEPMNPTIVFAACVLLHRQREVAEVRDELKATWSKRKRDDFAEATGLGEG